MTTADADRRLPVPARMHLVGGGPDGLVADQVLAPFVEDVRRRFAPGSGGPRLLLVMADDTGRAAQFRPGYVGTLDSVLGPGVRYLDAWLDGSCGLDPAALAGVDGMVVAGGPAPVYRTGLVAAAGAVRAAVAAGVPYLGFSAGAMVSAGRAIVGGWRDGGRAVCDEDWSEGLDELTIDAGLSLVELTVDVHAAQGGLLTRALSAAHRDGIDRVVAIDEGTCLSVPLGSRMDQGWQVSGSGAVWVIDAPAEAGARVRRIVR